MELTVGNATSFKPMIDETDKNVAYFGAKDDKQDIGSSNYRFKVTYDPEMEAFGWTFNEHITNFDRVQLTYTVKLAKRESAPGTYWVKTNGDTYLHPVNSNQQTSAP